MCLINVGRFDVIVSAIRALSEIRKCSSKFAYDLIMADMDRPLTLIYDTEFEALTMREEILTAINMFYGDKKW